MRLELRLNGELCARYEGRYVAIQECGAKEPAQPTPPCKAAGRKDHNAGGKSDWMNGFFERPGPQLWQAIRSQPEELTWRAITIQFGAPGKLRPASFAFYAQSLARGFHQSNGL